MHIGLTQANEPDSTVSVVKSIGAQKLKGGKEFGAAATNGFGAATTNGTTCSNGAWKQQQHACSEHQQQRTLRVHQPVVLNELQKNTVRVIGQYLRELGMHDTVDSLVEESACRIENPLSMKLRDSIQRCQWQKALGIIEKLRSQLTDKQYLAVRVLLLEEKFKELMSSEEYLLALRLLQVEYPKCKELRARHEYWANLLCSHATFSEEQHNQQNGHQQQQNGHGGHAQQQRDFGGGVGADSVANVLNVLRRVLPPSLMLPSNRLQELLKQSWLYQTRQCDLHVLSREQNVLDDRAILVDHQCTSREFPSKTTCTLYMHNAEVWYLKFSPCGRYLASGAKGNQVLIWAVESQTDVHIHQSIQILHDIVGVASIAWSQDSRYLAVCSAEQPNGTGCFIYYVPTGRLVKEYTHYAGDSFTSVSFFKDKSHKLACAGQKGHFHVYDVHREDHTKAFEGFRIRCLYACKDGRTVLAADTHNRIRKYDFENQREQTLIQEASQIMYFSVDREEKYCLVTTRTEGLRLWCLKTVTLVRTFFGAHHSEFVITSTFGGPDDSFIATGSEDHSVIIWNMRRSHPVRKLHGHTSTVNCVAWNPVSPRMLASGSDDGTIRIWSTPGMGSSE